jgi:agmatinase
MYNVLTTIPQVTHLVQVGVRDCCEAEIEFSRAQGGRVRTFFDPDLARRRYAGTSWAEIAREVTEALPEEVWISFDVDGLDPSFCPHTGTPVPGGLDFQEAVYLIATVARSGRRIVGFDLTEVAPDPAGASEWDANVGARLLYKLGAWTLASQGRAAVLPIR